MSHSTIPNAAINSAMISHHQDTTLNCSQQDTDMKFELELEEALTEANNAFSDTNRLPNDQLAADRMFKTAPPIITATDHATGKGSKRTADHLANEPALQASEEGIRGRPFTHPRRNNSLCVPIFGLVASPVPNPPLDASQVNETVPADVERHSTGYWDSEAMADDLLIPELKKQKRPGTSSRRNWGEHGDIDMEKLSLSPKPVNSPPSRARRVVGPIARLVKDFETRTPASVLRADSQLSRPQTSSFTSGMLSQSITSLRRKASQQH